MFVFDGFSSSVCINNQVIIQLYIVDSKILHPHLGTWGIYNFNAYNKMWITERNGNDITLNLFSRPIDVTGATTAKPKHSDAQKENDNSTFHGGSILIN